MISSRSLALPVVATLACAAAPRLTWIDVAPDDPACVLRGQSGVATRMLDIADARVRFVEVNLDSNQSDTPWVFVHGLGGSMQDFADLALLAAADARIVALDLPGFGGSVDTRGDYRIARYVEVLTALFEALELGRVHLVCHSLGGQTCIAFTLERAKQVATLTLIDAAGTYDQNAFLVGASEHFAGINVGNVDLRGPGIELLTQGDRLILRRMLGDQSFSLAALDSFAQNYRRRLHEVSVPTLIVWGTDDPLFAVDNAVDLKENIPDSELRLVDGAGHSPQETHAELLYHWIVALHERHAPPTL